MKKQFAVMASTVALTLAISAAGLPEVLPSRELAATSEAVSNAMEVLEITEADPLEFTHANGEIVVKTSARAEIDDLAQVAILADAGTAAIEISSATGSGVSIGLPTTSGHSDAETIGDDLLVFAGGTDEADITVQVHDDGTARTHTVVSDFIAPERFTYTVDTEEASAPHLTPEGSVLFLRPGATLENAVEEDLVGFLDAPWSVDASGSEIPTYYEVSGNEVTQVVAHRGAGVQYPVVSDPVWFIPALALLARGGMVAWKAAKAVKFFRAGAITAGRYTTTNGFSTFAQFKTRYGSRAGYDWHHIVEQKHAGKFAAKAIHNPNNLVQIPREIHQKCVNSIMGSKKVSGSGFTAASGKTMRQTVDSYSWSKAHSTGVAILRFCGVNI